MEKAQEARTKNDEGAAKDQATILVTGYIQDYLNAKYVSGTETASNEKAYITSKLQNGLQEGNYYIIVEDGTLNIYEDSTKTTKIAYGALQNNGTISWGIEAPVSLKIGDTVNYSTTLNGVTLNNWKVFYTEGNYLYLIYGDYLPVAAVPNITGVDTYDLFSIYSTIDRATFLNQMTNTSVWNDLLTGTINGTQINIDTTDENICAMGSPTLDLFVKSWNSSYTSNTIYTLVNSSAMDDGLYGYYINNSEPIGTTNLVDLSSANGYNNTIYFPHKEVMGEEAYVSGYLLNTPSTTNDYIYSVQCDGNVGADYFLVDYPFSACRPVICLPTSVINQ